MRARRFELSFPRIARVGVIWVGLLALVSGAAAQTIERVDMQSNSGITIEVTNLYGFIPNRGFVPMRVVINNTSDRDGEWRMTSGSDSTRYGRYTFNAQNYATEAVYAVPAHAAREFELLVPLAESEDYRYRSLEMTVTGTGVQVPYIRWNSTIDQPGRAQKVKTKNAAGEDVVEPPKTRKGLEIKESYSESGPLNNVPVYVALSPVMFRDQGDDIKDYLVNVCRRPTALAKLDIERLSADWRAYTGMTVMVFTAAEWTATPPVVRTAILQWVASGGELRLVADQEGGLALPARAGERYGAGFLEVFPAGELIDYDYTTVRYQPGGRFLFNMEYQNVPEAPRKLMEPPDTFDLMKPALSNQFVPVALLILVFALLVGPVNLFWFCRGSRRGRLLWVTPLLSLGTAVILSCYIVVMEGIGGDGIYYRLTLLEPQGKFAYVTEAQASKTGVLLGRSFTLPDPAWITVLKGLPGDQPNMTFSQAGPNYWGDWIKTRHEQTTITKAVVASRAAVRLAAGAADAPSLTSEYNGTLEAVYYLDAAHKPWKAAHLGNGQTVRLDPATEAELNRAWDAHYVRAPAEMQGVFRRLSPQPGAFFALSTNDPLSLEPALYGLNWTCFRHVVTGRVEP